MTQEREFEDRYKDWLSKQRFTPAELAALPRVASLADHVAGSRTLLDGVRKAHAVVVGTVTSLSFRPYETVVTFSVERQMKGDVGGEVSVVVHGGPWPTPDFMAAKLLVVDEAQPILLPGERAVLFLQRRADRPGTFFVENFSGLYRSSGGHIKGLEGNSFRGTVDGKSEAEFLEMVRAVERQG